MDETNYRGCKYIGHYGTTLNVRKMGANVDRRKEVIANFGEISFMHRSCTEVYVENNFFQFQNRLDINWVQTLLSLSMLSE